MDIQSLKIAYFSPTGTTKAIIQGIARGIDHSSSEVIDITKPDLRKQTLHASPDDLLMVAVPVYAGRVPAVLQGWLNEIKASDTPAVCVVVYGNRDYDDALLELKDTLQKRGCKPIAGAAFIGEHSFSGPDTPIAVARPDGEDLGHAEAFGRKLKDKLLSLSSADQISELKVPGNFPYKEGMRKITGDFIAVSDACTQCGVCAQECPVDAIDAKDSSTIDREKCILCCACIKGCPEKARTMMAGPVMDIAIRLNKACQERKEPVFFIDN
ncbi:Fe-4S ferredoxin, iron-sulfur binding domain protein [Desulfosarcina variabilis str. Montpellier]|mgnify:CR=1 FL=1|uniref:EFR1 family ferrodoxin n=1 Tax=Desulfosarcina variabilis TaxID=2300 RepID=UPI003AFA0362